MTCPGALTPVLRFYPFNTLGGWSLQWAQVGGICRKAKVPVGRLPRSGEGRVDWVGLVGSARIFATALHTPVLLGPSLPPLPTAASRPLGQKGRGPLRALKVCLWLWGLAVVRQPRGRLVCFGWGI